MRRADERFADATRGQVTHLPNVPYVAPRSGCGARCTAVVDAAIGCTAPAGGREDVAPPSRRLSWRLAATANLSTVIYMYVHLCM